MRYWAEHKRACILFYTTRFWHAWITLILLAGMRKINLTLLTRYSFFFLSLSLSLSPHSRRPLCTILTSDHTSTSFQTYYELFCRNPSCTYPALWRSNLCLCFIDAHPPEKGWRQTLDCQNKLGTSIVQKNRRTSQTLDELYSEAYDSPTTFLHWSF